jgi:hypothetical protein
MGAFTVDGVINAERQAGSVTVSTNEVVPAGMKVMPESVIRFILTVYVPATELLAKGPAV